VTNLVYATGVQLTSDRNAKENFHPVDPERVLTKVAALSITQWTFKQDSATPHIGPMAQDFHAAFQVGADDKHIAVVDEGGVALAAIQGLNRKVEVRSHRAEDRMRRLETKLERKEAEIDELKCKLDRLERLLETGLKAHLTRSDDDKMEAGL
jgi:hypothetical protein